MGYLGLICCAGAIKQKRKAGQLGCGFSPAGNSGNMVVGCVECVGNETYNIGYQEVYHEGRATKALSTQARLHVDIVGDRRLEFASGCDMFIGKSRLPVWTASDISAKTPTW
jgi:hypothetical protein